MKAMIYIFISQKMQWMNTRDFCFKLLLQIVLNDFACMEYIWSQSKVTLKFLQIDKYLSVFLTVEGPIHPV